MNVPVRELIDAYMQTQNQAILTRISRRLNMPIQDIQELYDLRHAKIMYYNDVTERANLHIHAFYEILFICKSDGIQYHLDGKRYRLNPGDLLIVPPGMEHGPLNWEDSTAAYERFSLWLSPAFLEAQKLNFPDLDYAVQICGKTDSWLIRFAGAEESDLRARFNSLWQERQMQHFGWESAVGYGAGSLLMVINRYIHDHFHKQAVVESRNMFDLAFRYIDVHLTEKLTVDQLAEYLHVSRSTVTHLFQKHLNLSFYQCVTQKRLLRAKSCIQRGVPLNEVWEHCGFGDYSSFYRMFKKEYGISPREYRMLRDGSIRDDR